MDEFLTQIWQESGDQPALRVIVLSVLLFFGFRIVIGFLKDIGFAEEIKTHKWWVLAITIVGAIVVAIGSLLWSGVWVIALVILAVGLILRFALTSQRFKEFAQRSYQRLVIKLRVLGHWLGNYWQLVLALLLLVGADIGAFLLTRLHWPLLLTLLALVLASALFALWFYSTSRRSMTSRQPPVFYDTFDPFVDWQEQESWGGALFQSGEQKRIGSYSLKKSGTRGDPSGGFKEIGAIINRGFVLSGWLYRPSGSVDGPCDRLAVENGEFNGYGFTVDHRDGMVWIDLREDGRSSEPYLSSKNSFNLPEGQRFKDQWYQFEFYVRANGRLEIHIYDSLDNLIGSAGVSNDQYNSFDRVAVHGGSPYYVDALRIGSYGTNA
jgi:Ca2+/Na+ antiporter